MATQECPCGYLGDVNGRCRCTPQQVQQYRGRLSGPLLDRIDLHVNVPRLSAFELSKFNYGDDSERVAQRVLFAHKCQVQRTGDLNARMSHKILWEQCTPAPRARKLLIRAVDQFGLSARSWDRILRVARTIADLQGSAEISTVHMGEALALRQPEPGQKMG